MDRNDNLERAARAENALGQYFENDPCLDSAVIDFLSDLMHLMNGEREREKVDLHRALEMAEMHFEAEKAEADTRYTTAYLAREKMRAAIKARAKIVRIK